MEEVTVMEIRNLTKNVKEMVDSELDRVMSWNEIAIYTNYSKVHIKTFADEMSPVIRGGRRIGARKRNVIEWIKRNERPADLKTKSRSQRALSPHVTQPREG